MTPFTDSASTGPAGKILQALRKYDPPETSKPAASRRAEKWYGSREEMLSTLLSTFPLCVCVCVCVCLGRLICGD